MEMWNLSSLDIFVVRRQSTNDTSAFRDFTVRKSKVDRASVWLKENNPHYNDIIINSKILDPLPENGSILNLIPQLTGEQSTDENEEANANEDESVIRT